MSQGLGLRYRFFVLSFLVLGLAANSQAWALSKERLQPPANPTLNNPQPHGALTLRVMSYNVQALAIQDGADESKLIDIGKILKQRRQLGDAPHIVSIQEGFHGDVQKLIRESGYPYKLYGPPAAFPQSSSGLIVLSEYPIVNWAMKAFKQENSAGMDWNAKKGVMWLQVQLPTANAFLDIMNTHMQADYKDSIIAPNAETVAARKRQHVEVKNFFWNNVKTNAAVIFAGDFNTNASLEDYYDIVSYTLLFDAGEYCAIFNNCATNVNPLSDIKYSLDHQFFRDNGNLHLEPFFYKKTFNTKVNGRYLSDHDALEVHYKVTW